MCVCIFIYLFMYMLELYRVYTWCLVVLEKQAAGLDATFVPNSMAFFKRWTKLPSNINHLV